MRVVHHRGHGGFEIGVDLCLHVRLKQGGSWGGYGSHGRYREVNHPKSLLKNPDHITGRGL
jgi:hypothetical protein